VEASAASDWLRDSEVASAVECLDSAIRVSVHVLLEVPLVVTTNTVCHASAIIPYLGQVAKTLGLVVIGSLIPEDFQMLAFRS
jgi:hypothetical protein